MLTIGYPFYSVLDIQQPCPFLLPVPSRFLFFSWSYYAFHPMLDVHPHPLSSPSGYVFKLYLPFYHFLNVLQPYQPSPSLPLLCNKTLLDCQSRSKSRSRSFGGAGFSKLEKKSKTRTPACCLGPRIILHFSTVECTQLTNSSFSSISNGAAMKIFFWRCSMILMHFCFTSVPVCANKLISLMK